MGWDTSAMALPLLLPMHLRCDALSAFSTCHALSLPAALSARVLLLPLPPPPVLLLLNVLPPWLRYAAIANWRCCCCTPRNPSCESWPPPPPRPAHAAGSVALVALPAGVAAVFAVLWPLLVASTVRLLLAPAWQS